MHILLWLICNKPCYSLQRECGSCHNHTRHLSEGLGVWQREKKQGMRNQGMKLTINTFFSAILTLFEIHGGENTAKAFAS